MGGIWGQLGLGRVQVRVGKDEALFHEGAYSSRASSEHDVTVATGWTPTGAADALDIERLARLLHPTMSDHGLPSLCAWHDILYRSEAPARSAGELLGALVEEAGRLDREVLALLGQFSDPPLSTLFERLLPLPQADPLSVKDEVHRIPSSTAAGGGAEGEWLDDGGWVSSALPTFERRDGQIRMARQVRRTLHEGGALVVEAGPGTGKTFAYLIPAIEHLLEEDGSRIVISTRTKQLQEQLFHKDLPFLLSGLSAPPKVALLKGRENYLCLRRWQLAASELAESLERDRLSLLAPLVRWLWETETGDIDENAAYLAQPGASELWARLRDSHIHCVEPFCPHAGECLSIRQRQLARGADLVVVNHALLLSDTVAGRGILGDYTHLIVDEGHALESSARSAFTVTFAPRVVEGLADELTTSRHRRTGYIRRLGGRPEEIDHAEGRVQAFRSEAAGVFAALDVALPRDRQGIVPGLDARVIERMERLRAAISDLDSVLEGMVDETDAGELKHEGEGHLQALRELFQLLADAARRPAEDAVQWFDREAPGVALHRTPLDVASILADRLYPALTSIVVTSATLSVEEDFSYLLQTLGLDAGFERVETLVVPSPFSYEDSMHLFVPETFPLPTEEGDAYVEHVADLLTALDRGLQRKGLVLFTSYQMMEEVSARLPESVLHLVQGRDGPRSKLIQRFKGHSGGMLLLGTDSFWEGVDLPGSALEVLVITRLPFHVPSDPVLEAMARRARARGENPFSQLALPRAVLRLRQGVGRLIRTCRDRGVAIVTDRRIVTKPYGAQFRNSLPVEVRVSSTSQTLVETARAWIDEDS